MVDQARSQTDKRRYTRRKVLIPARMKHDAGWSDVCIRDISTRGMLVQGAAPPKRGAYVELRRSAHVIVAKVTWVQERQFGLSTQDALPIESIINPEAAGFGRSQAAGAAVQVERRAAPRSAAQSHASSRHISGMMQYGFVIVIAVCLAIALLGFVRDAFNRSMEEVAVGLSGKPAPSAPGSD